MTRKKERRVNGVEQLTVDCVCHQCRVLSLMDCELLDMLWVCELDSPSQSKSFIGHEASSAKLASRS